MAQELTAEQRNGLFLAHSIERTIKANAPNGKTYAPGQQLIFNAPVVPGWASKARIFFDLTPTVTLAGGTVAVSQIAPYNFAQNIKVLYGGTERRNHHPYALKLLQQFSEHDGGSPRYAGPVVEGYSAGLFTVPAAAEGANSWKGWIDVPLQFQADSVVGLLPMGASASPVSIQLDCASSFLGTDPMLNALVKLTGAPTVAVTGTIDVVFYYRYGQSPHDPAFKVPTPVIGFFPKMIQQEVSVTSNANYIPTELREPFEHLAVFQELIIPGNAGELCSFANIKGAKFLLDPSTPWMEYTPENATIGGKWAEQRQAYGQDLDAGVISWDFISGADAKKNEGLNTVNVGQYNASQTQLLYDGVLAANSNRIMTQVLYLEPLPF